MLGAIGSTQRVSCGLLVRGKEQRSMPRHGFRSVQSLEGREFLRARGGHVGICAGQSV